MTGVSDWLNIGMRRAVMQKADHDILWGIKKSVEDDRPVTADDFDLDRVVDPAAFEVTKTGEDEEGLFVVVRKPDGTEIVGIDPWHAPPATSPAPPSVMQPRKVSQDQTPAAEPAESPQYGPWHTPADLMTHCTTDHERKVLARVLQRIEDEKKRAAIMERARRVRDGDVHNKPDEPEDWWDRNRIAMHVDPALYGIQIKTPESFVHITNTSGT